MTVVISGANGFVAKNLRKNLHHNKIKFIGISRKNFKNFPLEKKLLSNDYTEKSLISALNGCDVFIHLIGVGKQNNQSNYDEINNNLTKKIIKLCKKSRIRKIIFISGLGVSRNNTSSYFLSKYRAEQEIINSGLNYTIFRPSYIIGKDDYLTKNLNSQIKTGKIIIPGSGKYYIQPIFINDVTEIIFQAIFSKKFSRKIIDLVGSEKISFEKFIHYFNKKSKVKVQKISFEKLYHEAMRNPNSDFGIDDLNILVGNFTGNHNKLKKLTRLKFTSFKDVL